MYIYIYTYIHIYVLHVYIHTYRMHLLCTCLWPEAHFDGLLFYMFYCIAPTNKTDNQENTTITHNKRKRIHVLVLKLNCNYRHACPGIDSDRTLDRRSSNDNNNNNNSNSNSTINNNIINCNSNNSDKPTAPTPQAGGMPGKWAYRERERY